MVHSTVPGPSCVSTPAHTDLASCFHLDLRPFGQADGARLTVTFGVLADSGASAIVNADYGVSATGGYRATGVAVVTFVDGRAIYLPAVQQ